MIDNNKRKFLQSIGVLIPAALGFQLLNSSNQNATTLKRNYTIIPPQNNNVSNSHTNNINLESKLSLNEDNNNASTYIQELRKYAPNTPSKEIIYSHYNSMKKNGVIENILESSKRYELIPEFLIPILCIEQGSPYKGSNYGLAVESPTGCKGIAQLSFGAFFDVIKWYHEQNLNQNYTDSNLDEFLKSYRKGISQISIAKKKIIDEINQEELLYEEETLNEIIKNRLYSELEKQAKEYLRVDFLKLFESPKIVLNNKTYSTTAIQIEIMAAYLKKLYEPLKNWDFTIGSYNHGLGTTKALISKYQGKQISVNNLSNIIENNQLNYRKLYSKKGIEQYLKDYKESTGLTYLDKEYYTKVLIAFYELNT